MPPVYATADDLRAYVKRNVAVKLPDDLDDLLEEAEREVDRLSGPWPILSTGRKFDPGLLPVYAREALKRATCAAAEWLLMLEPEEHAGVSDVLPGDLTLVQRAGRTPLRAVEEMAGHGLLAYSGTLAYVDPIDAA